MSNNYILPLFVAGSLMLALFGFFLVAYLLVQKRKQNKYQLEKQKMMFDHENNILKTKIEEQENTSDQISKELHDNIKSVLGFVQMSMYSIADMATSNEQSTRINTVNSIISEVIDNLHNISHSLSSNFVRHIGLVETITKDLESIKMNKNITYNIEIIGTSISLSPDRELHVYRIAQEALQNCIKHAKATNIDLTLDFEPERFMMKIADNGIGFQKNEIYEMKGLGFLNMLQRARYVHGSLDLNSVPQKGTTVTLTLNTRTNGINN
jgi:hypothetical protein